MLATNKIFTKIPLSSCEIVCNTHSLSVYVLFNWLFNNITMYVTIQSRLGRTEPSTIALVEVHRKSKEIKLK